ncbi:MAG: hypothetical protein MK101_09395 [Phycisphaerales bacterium]|nr:hypothetical protein [Phycisphaerales bacterium]
MVRVMLGGMGAVALSVSVMAGGGDTCEEAQTAVWGTNSFNTSTASPSDFPAPDEDMCPDAYLDWLDSPDRWFVFVPDVDQINIDTCLSSSYDTSLVVYEGDSCDTIVQIACSGDGSGLDGCQAYYSNIPDLDVTPGETYYIRLGGWNGASGTGELHITPGAGTIPGACCSHEGVCTNGTLADCMDSGGIFAGADTTCAGVDCDDYLGACCIGGACEQISQSACAGVGHYAGDGTSCDGFDCDVFLGACCAYDTCFITDENECGWVDGVFFGPGVQCDDPAVDCGPDRGACCLEDGTCQDDRTEIQCSVSEGEWQGADSTCDSVDCDSGGGGGDPGDVCETAFKAVIGNNPFNTGAATMSPFPPPNEGQCAGTYLDWDDSPDVWFRWEAQSYGRLTLDTCQSGSYDTSLAVYQGPDCTDLDQIACNGDGSGLNGCQAYYSYIQNIDVTFGEVYWFRLGGWNGASGSGVLDVSFEDTGNTPGACCIDVDCVIMTGNECGGVGGLFFAEISCSQIDCSDPDNTGACCLDGECYQLASADCDAFAGTFFSVGTPCSEIDCADPVGACCNLQDCYPATPNWCEVSGGEWQGEGVVCGDIQCGCEGDVTGDGLADVNDVLALITEWGTIGHVPEDLNGDGEVGVEDLLIILQWFNNC